MKPRISIITSIYKCEKFMHHFLEDVSRQSVFDECELILLDADSPENESSIIKKFQAFFPRQVIYKRLSERLNLYETWNLGIKLAQADLLTNWNSDDRRVWNSLDLQAREFDLDPSVDVCYGPTLTTHVENEKVEDCKSRGGFGCFDVTLPTMLTNNSPHCLPMWKKDLHQRFGPFNAAYGVAGDYEMWLRALVGGAKFKRIKPLIGSYYRNPEGISSNPEGLAKAMEEITSIRRHYIEYLDK